MMKDSGSRRKSWLKQKSVQLLLRQPWKPGTRDYRQRLEQEQRVLVQQPKPANQEGRRQQQ